MEFSQFWLEKGFCQDLVVVIQSIFSLPSPTTNWEFSQFWLEKGFCQDLVVVIQSIFSLPSPTTIFSASINSVKDFNKS